MSKRNPDRDPFDRYFTAAKLAERIAEWARIEPGMWVLEPSAGEGALAQPARARGAHVVAVESQDDQIHKLRLLPQVGLGGLVIHQADFMRWDRGSVQRGSPENPFDLALMNPPFSDGADGKHVAHASRMAKRVVALVRTNFEHTAGRWLSCLQYVRITRKAMLVSRPPAFGGPGARDQTPQSDYVVLELQRRQSPRQEGEADLVAVEYWV